MQIVFLQRRSLAYYRPRMDLLWKKCVVVKYEGMLFFTLAVCHLTCFLKSSCKLLQHAVEPTVHVFHSVSTKHRLFTPPPHTHTLHILQIYRSATNTGQRRLIDCKWSALAEWLSGDLELELHICVEEVLFHGFGTLQICVF